MDGRGGSAKLPSFPRKSFPLPHIKDASLPSIKSGKGYGLYRQKRMKA